MSHALRVLLHEVFDYAGLFPPASLPIERAAGRYEEHSLGPESWIMRRFIAPVGRLTELIPLIQASEVDDWKITLIGSGLPTLADDLRAVKSFVDATAGRAEVEAYEVRSTLAELESMSLKPLENAPIIGKFVELPWGTQMIDGIHLLADREIVGVKARMGGQDAAAFPPIEQVAHLLQECVNLDLPFKLTAGLHHPLPYLDAELGVTHHGFLNVILTSLLAEVHDLNRRALEKILHATDPASFWFEGDRLGFQDWDVELEDIEIHRDLFSGIGSCSIDEPVEGLLALGYLGEVAAR